MLLLKSLLIYNSSIYPVADPGFPRGGGTNSSGGGPTYDFAKISQKLHEIERIRTRGGVPWAPPLDPPLISVVCCWNSTNYLQSGQTHETDITFRTHENSAYAGARTHPLSFSQGQTWIRASKRNNGQFVLFQLQRFFCLAACHVVHSYFNATIRSTSYHVQFISKISN